LKSLIVKIKIVLFLFGVLFQYLSYAQNVDIHSSDVSLQRSKIIHFADSLLGVDFQKAYDFCSNEIISIDVYDRPDMYCDLMFRVGISAFQLGQREKSDSIMRSLISFELKNLHPLLQAQILFFKAKASDFYGLKIDAVRYAKESLLIYEQNQEFNGLIDNNVLMGKIYLSMDRIELAMQYFNKAIDYSEESHVDLYLFRSYINSVGALLKINQMKEAQKRLLTVDEIAERTKKINQKAGYFHMMGKVFYQQKNFQKSIEYFDKSIQMYDKLNKKVMKSIIITWKAAVAMELGQYRKAVNYNQEALRIRQKVHAVNMQASSMYNIASSLLDLKKYDSALYYINQGEDLYIPYRNRPDYIRAYDLKQKLYLDQKDYKNAFLVLEKSKAIRDSLFHVGNQRKLKELESDLTIGKFEQLRKEMETEANLQQIQNDWNNLILNFLIITLVLVIMTSNIYFVYVRNKNKRKVILANQKLIFIQMNSHFVFNALTAIQSLIYKKQLESAIHYLTIFSSLINKVIATAQKRYISLQAEISFVLEFLQIQKLRFGDDLKFQVNINDDLELSKILIPPMLTYPFIEYAVEECVQKAGNNAYLIIDIRKSGNVVQYQIIDKGLGFIDMEACFIKRYGGQEISCEQLTKERISVYNRFFKSRITFAEKKVILEGKEYNSLQFLIKK